MSKILLTTFFILGVFLSYSQTEEHIGYLVISKNDASVTYISPLIKCDLLSNYGERHNQEYKIGEHFRNYIKTKYAPENISGTGKQWFPMRMEATATERYNKAIELYRKDAEVIVVKSSDYQCDCNVE